MSDEAGDLERGANRLKVVAHPTRLHIVARLLERPANAGELAKIVDCAIADVEAQLRILIEAGLVQRDDADSPPSYSLSTEVSLSWLGIDDEATIDFGCCKLKLTQIRPPDTSG
jgi:DNA-binding transcriptional ArsR family regulator